MNTSSEDEDIAALTILCEEIQQASHAISRLAANRDNGAWVAARKKRLLVVTAYVFIRMGITAEDMNTVFEGVQYFYNNILERGDKGEATQMVG